MENAAFAGTYGKNPFHFKHFDLNSIGLRVNGKNLPTRAITPNFTTGHVIDCYQSLFQASNQLFDDKDNALDVESYIGGSTLYAFSLTPDYCSPANPIQTGNVDLSLRFGTALPNTVSLIVYAQFENNIMVDQYRNVITDIHS